MNNRTRHEFSGGDNGPNNDYFNRFLSGINEAKSLGEDQAAQSACVTHFGETSNYVSALAACAEWPSLKSICVMCQGVSRLQEINNAVPTLIEVLHSNPQLEEICLTHVYLWLNDETERLFDAVRQHPGLQTVNLSGAVFADKETQTAFFAALAEKKNLVALTGLFTWHGDAGFSQLVRKNNSVQSIDFIPYSYAAKLIEDLTANPDSQLKYLGLGSHHTVGVTIPGDTVMKLVQILCERYHGDFRLNNDYQSGASFKNMEQAEQLLEVAQLNFLCVISLEVRAIGLEYRYTNKGDYNPTVKLYQDKLNAIRDRNEAMWMAYLDQSRDVSEVGRGALPELVYLHHRAKYEDRFKVPLKKCALVSLKATTWFQLFKQNPQGSRITDEVSTYIEQANQRILNNKHRYKL